jgi:hypothetical protein
VRINSLENIAVPKLTFAGIAGTTFDTSSSAGEERNRTDGDHFGGRQMGDSVALRELNGSTGRNAM